MKNLKIFLVLFFCCTVHGYGQSITFTFLGKNIQGDKTINVDRVYLFNETNGSDTLVIGNTFSVLISSADIFDQANMNKITSYPNPFKKQVNISFYSSFYERAQVDVYTIDGKKIAGWNSYINIGENNLLLKSGVEGILLVSIHSKNIRLSTKLICTEKSSYTELAGFTNTSDIPNSDRHKSATIWDGAFEYRLGDSLSLKGYSNNMVSEIIHDVPFGNKEYTFLFEIMDEAPKADFIINARSVNQGEVINFTDLSSNLPTEWHWDFGDGGTSDLQNPG